MAPLSSLLLALCASISLADDPTCPLFHTPGYLGSLGAALDNWSSPSSSTTLDPHLTIAAQVSTCNSSCWASSTCAAWGVIFVTPSSGKDKPVCSLYAAGVGCWRDPNQASGAKAPLPLPSPSPPPPPPSPPPSGITFNSSNPALQAAWDFAVPQAMAYVMTGKGSPPYMPCYLAGLLDRPAYYTRDTAHHALGAHLLGLDKENLAMMRVFAASATPPRAYFPLWSFDFYGNTYPLDYKSDTDYVRETPSPFDIIVAAARLSQWTGDGTYATDPTLWASWSSLFDQFIALHSPHGDGLVGWANPTGNIFFGAASYVENGEGLILAADTLAKEAAGFEAFAQFQGARGNATGAAASRAQARSLINVFRNFWYNQSAGGYMRGITATGPKYGWGETQTLFPALHGLLEPGERAQAHLATILAGAPGSGTEPRTYVPEALFLHGLPDAAAAFIAQLLADPRKTYPEVSYTLVADLAVHLLGIGDPQCSGSSGSGGSAPISLSTLGGNLPNGTAQATAASIPLCGGTTIAVTQLSLGGGDFASMLTVQTGDGGAAAGIQWEARIVGSFSQLSVNGVARAATGGVTDTGLQYSFVSVPVAVGDTARVSTSGTK